MKLLCLFVNAESRGRQLDKKKKIFFLKKIKVLFFPIMKLHTAFTERIWHLNLGLQGIRAMVSEIHN